MVKWKRISKARYWEMLEILPPAVMGGGGFMVGEPCNHTPEGIPTFAAFKQTGEAYFEASAPMTIAEFLKVVPGARSYAYSTETQEAI